MKQAADEDASREKGGGEQTSETSPGSGEGKRVNLREAIEKIKNSTAESKVKIGQESTLRRGPASETSPGSGEGKRVNLREAIEKIKKTMEENDESAGSTEAPVDQTVGQDDAVQVEMTKPEKKSWFKKLFS